MACLIVSSLWLLWNCCCVHVVFFFFKQKTAYEIYYGLVGSEMCIRDSVDNEAARAAVVEEPVDAVRQEGRRLREIAERLDLSLIHI